MGRKTLFFIILFLISGISTCWANDSTAFNDQNAAIHTYGGGELLKNVFNSISMLIYGNSESGIDKTFNGMLRIALTVGGFCCICLAFFREKFEPLIKNFFLPGIVIMNCLLVPRTTVYIQDHLAQKAISDKFEALIPVDHVPFFLGKLATLVSTVSYEFNKALENVAHGVNDKLYDWTGHIYAGENIFLTKKCRIANPAIEDNFREFCRECVFRDLGLGLYSKGELIHSSNILKFVEENTSQIRTVYYRELLDEDKAAKGSFIPCREAIRKMNALFDKKSGNAKEILVGEIGNDFEFLLRQKAAGETDLRKLIKQQIAINLLKEEIPGTLNSFASKRAELLQKENQKILGALGASSIVAMRNFFEATIYMVFPLIILICLLSFGLKPLINWTHFILWVNSWPPFYVVVKFLLNTIWEIRAKKMFGDSFGLTIFTSEGLSDLYGSMESIAAISMAFIPFLSWILLKGGVSQMVQLASSIMSPAQAAASTAAAEKTYGNYSYGNMNLDNLSGYNAQTFQQTYSGRLSHGSVSLDGGMQTMTYTPSQDEIFIKQGDSYLREGITKTKAFSNAVQNSLSTSETALSESSKAVSTGLNDVTNKSVGFMQALSKQYQTGENFNLQTSSGVQEAHQFIQGIASDYGKSQGISEDKALREVLSAGYGISLGIKGGMDVSHQDGVSKSSSDSIIEKAAESETFQKHLQTLTQASSGEMANLLSAEDARLHQDLSRSFNETSSSVGQWRAAYSKHEALSSLRSDSESDSLSVHQNLNQRFVEFLQEEYHNDIGKMTDAIEMPNEAPEKQELIKSFINGIVPGKIENNSTIDMEKSYARLLEENSKKVTDESYNRDIQGIIEQRGENLGSFGGIQEKVNTFKTQTQGQLYSEKESMNIKVEESLQKHASLKGEMEDSVKKNETLWPRFLQQASTVNVAKSGLNLLASGFKKIGGQSEDFDQNMSGYLDNNYQELFGNADEVHNPRE